MTVTIENTNVDTTLNIAELTTASLTGTGVFDVLLQTLRLHLDREFTSGRITGTAYATVYSQALTAFLQQSVGFCLSKAKLALELQQMQEQVTLLQKQQDKLIADTLQVEYVTANQLPAETALKNKQVELLEYDLTYLKPSELALAEEELALKEKQTALVDYDLVNIKPQELALVTQQVATQQYTVEYRMPAEVADIEAGVALKEFELTDIKPNEKAQIIAQTSHISTQELNTVQQTLNLESQQLQVEAETSRVVYETLTKLPEEVQLIKLNQDQAVAQNNKIATDTVIAIKQGHLTDAQTCQVTAQTNQINAEVALKLPEDVELIKRNQNMVTAQVSQVEAQTGLLAYDLEFNKPIETDNLTTTGTNLTKQGDLIDSQKVVADKQALSVQAETTQTIYKTNYVLPEEVKVIKYNQDMVVAQTAKVSVDAVTASKQGALLDAQVCEVKASANKINAEVALKLPEEVVLLQRNQDQTEAQTTQISYTTTSVLPAQVAQTTYTTSNILPAQLALTTAQKESSDAQTALYEQKVVTETAQTTSTPTAGSVMGVQNALMAKQTENYLRDAEQKAAKIMIETWAVRQNTDGGQVVTTNHLGDTYIATAVDALLAGI